MIDAIREKLHCENEFVRIFLAELAGTMFLVVRFLSTLR